MGLIQNLISMVGNGKNYVLAKQEELDRIDLRTLSKKCYKNFVLKTDELKNGFHAQFIFPVKMRATVEFENAKEYIQDNWKLASIITVGVCILAKLFFATWVWDLIRLKFCTFLYCANIPDFMVSMAYFITACKFNCLSDIAYENGKKCADIKKARREKRDIERAMEEERMRKASGTESSNNSSSEDPDQEGTKKNKVNKEVDESKDQVDENKDRFNHQVNIFLLKKQANICDDCHQPRILAPGFILTMVLDASYFLIVIGHTFARINILYLCIFRLILHVCSCIIYMIAIFFFLEMWSYNNSGHASVSDEKKNA